jgi:hypothetical protein
MRLPGVLWFENPFYNESVKVVREVSKSQNTVFKPTERVSALDKNTNQR